MKTTNLNIKETALKLNEFALKKVNLAIDKSLNNADTAHHFVATKVDEFTKLSAKTQDQFFNSLEKSKKMVWSKMNKSLDFFSKN